MKNKLKNIKLLVEDKQYNFEHVEEYTSGSAYNKQTCRQERSREQNHKNRITRALKTIITSRGVMSEPRNADKCTNQ